MKFVLLFFIVLIVGLRANCVTGGETGCKTCNSAKTKCTECTNPAHFIQLNELTCAVGCKDEEFKYEKTCLEDCPKDTTKNEKDMTCSFGGYITGLMGIIVAAILLV